MPAEKIMVEDLINAMLANPELMNDFMDFNVAIDNAIDELGLSEDEAIDYVCNQWNFGVAADLISEVE